MNHSFLLILLLFASNALASFNKARATGVFKCRFTPRGITINKETVPLHHYLLEVMDAYGKHTFFANAAFNAYRSSGLEGFESPSENEMIVLPHNAGYSDIIGLLGTARERATALIEQLRCFQDALVYMGDEEQGKWTMVRVVLALLEEVEQTKAKLDVQGTISRRAVQAQQGRDEGLDGESSRRELKIKRSRIERRK